MNLYQLFDSTNSKARLDELPKWLGGRGKSDDSDVQSGIDDYEDEKYSKDYEKTVADQEKQARELRLPGKFRPAANTNDDDVPGDEKLHPHHRGDDDQKAYVPQTPQPGERLSKGYLDTDLEDVPANVRPYIAQWYEGIGYIDILEMDNVDPLDPGAIRDNLYAAWWPVYQSLNLYLKRIQPNWRKQYPASAQQKIHDDMVKVAKNWIYAPRGLPYFGSGNVERYVLDDHVFYIPISKEVFKLMFDDLKDAVGSPRFYHYFDDDKFESVDREELALEGSATVFSDHLGHHLKNADGEVVQSFENNPEGLRTARNALYKNYNVLSMEKPKESAMNEYEDKFNTALNESLTITTTAGTDQPDNVSVNATDEDAHTLVAILKAAGLPYKEREAQLVAATPCGEQVEEEYANEPQEKNMSVDYMVNQLSGGLGKQQKMYRKEYPGDNAMAVNEENLMRGLWDLYKKV